mmetsp:Transcript_6539/g.8878  ORF Transcript_6539/g.8878 Transcript_6539/m.8878 type:complete len:182 (+) Transcript_6539:303-848(+)
MMEIEGEVEEEEEEKEKSGTPETLPPGPFHPQRILSLLVIRTRSTPSGVKVSRRISQTADNPAQIDEAQIVRADIGTSQQIEITTHPGFQGMIFTMTITKKTMKVDSDKEESIGKVWTEIEKERTNHIQHRKRSGRMRMVFSRKLSSPVVKVGEEGEVEESRGKEGRREVGVIGEAKRHPR